MQEVYITHAKRTALGRFLGSLSNIAAPELGANVVRAILEESKLDPFLINEIILGQVLTGGSGQNPARQTVVKSNLPIEIPAMTINKVCGSGLKAVALAASAIRAGDAEIIIAGGQENMSLGMHGSYMRAGNKFGNTNLVDFMMYDGLTDAFSGETME